MKEKHKRIVLKLVSNPYYYKGKRHDNLKFRRELDRCLVDCVLLLQASYHSFDDPYKSREFGKYMDDIRERNPTFQFSLLFGLVMVYYGSVIIFELEYSKQPYHFAFIER